MAFCRQASGGKTGTDSELEAGLELLLPLLLLLLLLLFGLLGRACCGKLLLLLLLLLLLWFDGLEEEESQPDVRCFDFDEEEDENNFSLRMRFFIVAGCFFLSEVNQSDKRSDD